MPRPSCSRESMDVSAMLVDAACPACLAMYSDSDPMRVPRLPPLCGHSMCTECIAKVRACVVCRKGFYGDSSTFKVNYTLMGLVSELSKQGDSNAVSEQCSSCEGRNRIERLRVCKTCARVGKIDTKKAKRSEILEFVYCSDCAIEKHLEKGHDMDKYMNYYNKGEMEAIADRVKTDVTNVRETILHIGLDANKGAQKWITDVNKLCTAGLKLRSAEDCQRLRSQVEREIMKVEEATDSLLGAQRIYIKKTEDSSAELHKILEELKAIKKKEKQMGLFGRIGLFYRSMGLRKRSPPAIQEGREDSLEDKEESD